MWGEGGVFGCFGGGGEEIGKREGEIQEGNDRNN